MSIIGAGAVGTALALALRRKKHCIHIVASKRGRSAALLGNKVGAARTGRWPLRTAEFDGIIFIAVPDDAVNAVAQQLVKTQKDFSRCIVFHTSGFLSSNILEALRKRGAAVGSFHPLQTFPKKGGDFKDWKNIWIGIEGNVRAVVAGKRIARELGARPFELSPAHKGLYHIAAVFSSNYVVTLLSILEELGSRIQLSRRTTVSMFEPLILQSVRNVKKYSAHSALTGPIARGDVRTVKSHRAVLKSKGLKPISVLYSVLAKETARLASKKDPSW